MGEKHMSVLPWGIAASSKESARWGAFSPKRFAKHHACKISRVDESRVSGQSYI
jgi:hypothetical protein